MYSECLFYTVYPYHISQLINTSKSQTKNKTSEAYEKKGEGGILCIAINEETLTSRKPWTKKYTAF